MEASLNTFVPKSSDLLAGSLILTGLRLKVSFKASNRKVDILVCLINFKFQLPNVCIFTDTPLKIKPLI